MSWALRKKGTGGYMRALERNRHKKWPELSLCVKIKEEVKEEEKEEKGWGDGPVGEALAKCEDLSSYLQNPGVNKHAHL